MELRRVGWTLGGGRGGSCNKLIVVVPADDDEHAAGAHLHHPGDGALLRAQHTQVYGGDHLRQQE